MRRLVTLVTVAVVGILLSLTGGAAASAAPPVVAGVEDFEFASFDADYHLGIDDAGHATLRTIETLVAVFPDVDQNRGIIRAIPNYYDGVPLETRVLSVVDENGADVPYEFLSTAEFTELALGTDDYVHGRTTYVITYEQRNVVRSFTDTNADEFYWDANGTGWPQPFHSVGVRVHVDAELAGVLTGEAACYVGAFGGLDQCAIVRVEESTGPMFVASAESLAAFETLTFAIGFEAGTFVQVDPVPVPGSPSDVDDMFPFARPSPAVAWWIDAGSYGSVALVVLGTAFAVVWRFIRPRSSRGSGIIVPQYTVPKDLNVMEAAEIIGRRSNGVPAQIVSFAVRGNLRILDYPVTGSGARYTLQLLSLEGLDEHERALMGALFGESGIHQLAQVLQSGALGDPRLGSVGSLVENALGVATAASPQIGAVQEVGIVDDSAAAGIAAVSKTVRDSVLARGLLQKRSPAAGITMAVLMFVMSFVAMGVFMLSVFTFHLNPWGIIGFILAMLAIFVCLGVAYRPPVPTAEGIVHEEYLLGIRDYLQLAEADRLRMLQSPEGAQRVRAEGLDPRYPAQRVKLYEKLLPFAMLWGIERQWAQELAIHYGSGSPDWFVTTGTFDASSFTVAVSSIAVTPVARNTARSSSSGSSWSGSSGGSFSGGSTGGGFSGGGGGGGGGGGR